MNRGVLSAAGAYTLWGLLPVYWKAIAGVPAFEVLCHRVIWSCVFLVLLQSAKHQWTWLRRAVKNPRTLLTSLGTACLLAVNWFVYIWAVSAGHVVDASLGYFVNPLISVVLGVIFLGERLRPWQWTAIALAAGGVTFLTVGYGTFPWIALTLAGTFGLYGLLRKTASLSSLEGLSAEVAFLFLPALTSLLYVELSRGASFGHTGAGVTALLTLTGVITAIPLLLFAYAARQVRLSTVGLLQYIAPTLQFLLGVIAYGEGFTAMRLVGFGIIWMALLIYSVEGMFQSRRPKSRALAPS
jgi:chloramphenicol-sensitive protein RarD